MFAFGSSDTAFVSPRHALYPHMTVFKNVLGDLSLRGWNADEIKARTKEMESWPWLSPIFYRACRELNEEELYLAALARALAPEPEKLLLELPEKPSPRISEAIAHIKNLFTLTITNNKTGTAWNRQI
jgi:ABC-type sugar transport system ATPase subunit